MILLRSKKNLDPLWYWMSERHAIYCKRQQQRPKPWTNDPILQSYRFCNVYRELDTVTMWIRRNWREPFKDHPNLWFAMCVARQINLPETLEEIGFPKTWQPERVRKIMKARAERGEKVYTGAYIITAGGQSGSKVDYTVDKVLSNIYNDRHSHRFFNEELKKGGNLRLAHYFLSKYNGFGPFLSYEVVTDLRWTRYLHGANDTHYWANAGPGAKRGLNRLFGRPTKYRIGQEQANEEMKYLLAHGMFCLPTLPKIEMRDIEHSLCETDKYLRVKNGEGRPRSKYDGAA